MKTLVEHACQVLDSRNASTAVRRVAAAAIVTAIDEGLELPKGAPRLLWGAVQSEDAPYIRVLSLGKVVDQDLVDELLAALLDGAVGDSVKDQASYVLATPEAARFISNERVDQLVETANDSDAVGRVASVISARHDVCAFNLDTVTRIRDFFLSSEDGRVRRHALSVDQEIPGIDTSFIASMISDEDSEVRIETANQVDWTHSELDPGWALETLNEAISVERHPGALTALFEARLRVYEKEGSGEEKDEDPFVVF